MTAAASTPDDDLFVVPVWQLADGDLADELRQAERVARLAAARTVALTAQAAQRGLPGRVGCRSLTAWVQHVLPATSHREAAAVARRAETLHLSPTAAELAPTREALAAGEITGAQADVITATVAALLPPAVPVGTVDEQTLAEAQTLLLREARVLEPTKLARVATYLRHRLDPDADDRLARDEQRQQEVRGLTLASLGSGMVHVQGLLTKTCGAVVKAAVDAWAAPQPAADGTPDPRTAAQRRHDALERLCGEAIAQPGLLPTSHGSPYRVVVKVTAETLAAALTDATHPQPCDQSGQPDQPLQGLLAAELPENQPVSARSLAEIVCGAELVPVLVDSCGNPLDVGRTQYLFPTKQRLAIAVRDEHCTWPGCIAPPAWCDVHHLTPFSRGGKTSVDNGTLLCGGHHRHVHATGMHGRLDHGHMTWGTDPPTAQATLATRATAAVDDLARRWIVRRRE